MQSGHWSLSGRTIAMVIDTWRAPRGVDFDSTAVRWFGQVSQVPSLGQSDFEVVLSLWEDIHPQLRQDLLGPNGLKLLAQARPHPDVIEANGPLIQKLLGLTTRHLEQEARLLSVVPTRPAEVVVQRDDLAGRIDRVLLPDAWRRVSAVALTGLVVHEIGAFHPERRMPVLMAHFQGRAYVLATPSMFFPLSGQGGGRGRGDPSGDRAPLSPAPTLPAAQLEHDLPTDM